MKNHLLAVTIFTAGLVAAPLVAQSAYAGGKSGSFSSTGGYSVSGSVKVSMSGKITLSGFKSTSGPDLYIYVGNGSASRRVAKLKRTRGSQSYRIPASLVGKISSVHVYCKRFSKNFGTARLR